MQLLFNFSGSNQALAFMRGEDLEMSQTDYDAAIAEFLRKKSVTRCPTACVAPTRTDVGDADRSALREYNAAREAAWTEKLRSYQQRLVA